MDFVKSQYARIQQQLAGLSSSQKMLTGTLVVIMVMTLFWWGRYAGTAEMEPVLDQSFQKEEIAQITARLASKNIQYSVSGDKILVPADRKFEVLADLSYQRLLPRDMESGFEEIIKNTTPWDPADKTQAFFNRAKEVTLSRVIQNFQGVVRAVVLIDATQQRRIGNTVQSSATVDIQTVNQEKPSKNLINAAADLVAGAQAGLARNRVKVIVDGVSWPVENPDEAPLPGGGSILENIQQAEKYYADKIATHLGDIAGVMVSVTVDLNLKSSNWQEELYDPTKVAKAEAESFTKTDETTANEAAAGEPGAGANTSASINAAPSSGGGGSVSEENKTSFENRFSRKVENSTLPAGSATVVGASVRVPRSHFIAMYKQRSQSTDKEPDDTVLQPFIDAESTSIRESVSSSLLLKQADVVKVSVYTDTMPALATAAPTATGSMTGLVGNHTKEIALGALAVISLFMVSMMVRKASPAPVIASLPEPKSAPQLNTAEELAGEATEGNPTLDGMELDEDAMRTQQMLQQVSTMVDENPDAAANLVKRWLNRS